MKEIPPTYAPGHRPPPDAEPEDLELDDGGPPPFAPPSHLWLWAIGVLFLLVLLALLPPLINANRFKRGIAASLGRSLGRSVHIDRVSIDLLPLPGFTLENLVVGEDPGFGAEPVIRANTVKATLRPSSLWSGRIEFSTISFTDPSVNLVHLPDGRWNIEAILLQASRIPSAPTAQTSAGPAPRFPYIEATGARLNIKQGQEKMPVSLTGADFALWLPQPGQWRFRLEAAPSRTDTSVSEAGIIHLEATIGRAPTLGQSPLHLTAVWRDVPLGQTSLLLLGHDAGWRGQMTLDAEVQGTVGASDLHTRLSLTGLRRTDFVPARLLDLDAACQAQVAQTFHSLSAVQCTWPAVARPGLPLVSLGGDWTNLRDASTAAFQARTEALPLGVLVEWMKLLSQRAPPELAAAGTLTGSLAFTGAEPLSSRWEEQAHTAGAALSVPDPDAATGSTIIPLGDISLRTARHDARSTPKAAPGRGLHPGSPDGPAILMGPFSVGLGGPQPALLQAGFDRQGYTLHLTGTVLASRLLELGQALPQFGDGLPAVLAPAASVTDPLSDGHWSPAAAAPAPRRTALGTGRGVRSLPHIASSATSAFEAAQAEAPQTVDLTASRSWGGSQTWTVQPLHNKSVPGVGPERRGHRSAGHPSQPK